MSPTNTNPTRVRDIMRQGVVTITEDDDLALAQQIMLWRELRHLPVLRAGRVVGVLSERDLLKSRSGETGASALAGRVRDAMCHPVETIDPGSPVADAAATLSLLKIGCLPVVDAGVLVGIVTTTDVLGASAWLPVEHAAGPETPVRTVMKTELAAAYPDDPLDDAVAMMLQRGVRHLPVIDGLKRVVGILSERDVRTAIGNPFEVLSDGATSVRRAAMKVSHAMTPAPRTIGMDAPLSQAVRALVAERFGALPVVDDEDTLVGMVSYLDLLAWRAST